MKHVFVNNSPPNYQYSATLMQHQYHATEFLQNVSHFFRHHVVFSLDSSIYVYSNEAQRIKLQDFLQRVQDTYYKYNSHWLSSKPDVTTEELKRGLVSFMLLLVKLS